MKSDIIGLREAAQELGVHYVTALRWCYAGKFPGAYSLPTQKRRHWRVDRKALLKYKRGVA